MEGKQGDETLSGPVLQSDYQTGPADRIAEPAGLSGDTRPNDADLTADSELIALGAEYIRILSVCYLCWGVTEVYIAVLRSTGRAN